MSSWSMLLTRLDVIVAALAVLSALKSGYNGTVRSLINNIKQIPEVAERVEGMEEKQDKMVDGLIAVSVAQEEEDTDVNTEKIADRLRDGESYRVFLDRNARDGRGVQQNPEDPEQDNRWHAGDDGD